MISDQRLMTAVSRILQRSERQDDPDKLLHSFVDVGLLPQLNNFNNQILYGRRGTGKTHVLRVLASRIREQNADAAVVYIDARGLGSTAQFSDPSISVRHRCLALFRDILGEIVNTLRDFALVSDRSADTSVLELIHELSTSIVEPIRFYRDEEIRTKTSHDEEGDIGVELGRSPVARLSSRNVARSETETRTIVTADEKILFPSIQKALGEVLREAGCRLFILLDEWSSLPPDIQPYLAEFIKRSILPIPRAVIKIASLEYRSRFSARLDGGLIGFELGADIATAPDLDDYYVYDRNPAQIMELYGDILFKHLAVELPAGYLTAVQDNLGTAGHGRVSAWKERVGGLGIPGSWVEASRMSRSAVQDEALVWCGRTTLVRVSGAPP